MLSLFWSLLPGRGEPCCRIGYHTILWRLHNWYTDTGATDHITAGMEKLSMHKKYHGKDQMQVANGACITISHISRTYIPTYVVPWNWATFCMFPIHIEIFYLFIVIHLITIPILNFTQIIFLLRIGSRRSFFFKANVREDYIHWWLLPLPWARKLSLVSRLLRIYGIVNSVIPLQLLFIIFFTQIIRPVAQIKDITHVCNTCQQAKSHQLSFSLSNNVS